MATDYSTPGTHLLGYQHHSPVPVQRKPLPADSQILKDKPLLLAAVEDDSHNTESKFSPSHQGRSIVPTWSSKPVLLCVLTILALISIALLLLWHFNRAENGFNLSLSSNHIAWTYGPTAILVVMVNVWRQIDYSFKSTQPWRVMSHSSDTAAKTIILDYLSPFQLTSLIDAIRNRHILVVCSIAGFMLLKIVTLISTGLLLATETLVTQPAKIRYDTSFDGKQFWLANPPASTQLSNSSESLGYVISDQDLAYSNLSDQIYYNLYLGFNNQTTAPIGFRENLAFQSFSLVNSYVDPIRKTGVVDVFVPNVTCETAQLTYMQVPPNVSTSQPYSGFELRSLSCPSYQGDEGAGFNSPSGVYRDMTNSLAILDNYECGYPGTEGNCTDVPPSTVYDFWRINCSSPTKPQYATDDRQSLLNEQTLFDFRIAMVTLNLSFHPYVVAATENDTTYKYQAAIDNYSAFVCRVGYVIQQANITVTKDQQYNFSISEDPSSARHLDNFTDLELSEVVYDLFVRTGVKNLDFNPLLNILKSVTSYYNGTTFNAYDLEGPLVRSLRGMAAMFMLQSFSEPTSTTGQGSVVVQKIKLHVDTAVIFIMVACLVIMCLMTIIFVTLSGRFNLPWSYDTIAGNAAVLASSKMLHDTLSQIGLASRKHLDKELESIHFHTTTDHNINIEMTCSSGNVDDRFLGPKSPLKPWKPLPVRRFMVFIMLLLPVATIAALEILAEVSTRQHGIITTSGQATSTTYVTRYLSTAVMFIIATLFNNFDFTVAILAPFSALASARGSARYGLRMNLLGKIPPHAFYHSVSCRQFGPALSIAASTIGSILTIVVSGLWVVSSTVTTQTAQVDELSLWSIDWNLNYSEYGAMYRFNAIQHNMETSPPTIWNDLVLPNLGSTPKLVKGHNALDLNNVSSSNFTFTVAGLRPMLSCEVVPSEDIDIQYQSNNASNSSFLTISARSELSQECRQSLPLTSNQTSINFTYYYDMFPSGYGWYGALVDLYIGFKVDGSESSGPPPFTSTDPVYDNPPNCPSLGAFFGFGHEVNDEQQLLSDATALVCYQKLQQLDIDVTYLGSPSNNMLSPTSPPEPHEASAVYIQDPASGANPSTLRIAKEMEEGLTFFPPRNGTLDNEHFFNFLLSGPDPPDIQDLTGEKGPQNLATAIDHIYRKFMVNVIDLNFRKSRNESDATGADPSNATVSGTVQTAVYRFTIDNTSKLILQVMLAAMVVLGALANIFMDIRGVLPRNPCSIARVMNLLSGSKLVEEAQPPSDKNNPRPADQNVYSLGWWRRDSPPGTRSMFLESSEDEDSSNEVNYRLRGAVQGGNLRFGVDVGTAAVLGFDISRGYARKWSSGILGRRRYHGV